MTRYYDIHNHLFNKNFLAKELLCRLMLEMKKYLHVDRESSRGMGEAAQSLENVIRALKRYSHAIRIFSRRSSIAIYEELDKTYKGEFILTPLTFDLTYCFASSSERGVAAEQEPIAEDVFESEMNMLFDMVERQAFPISRGNKQEYEPGDSGLWKKYLAEKESFLKNCRKFRNFEQNRERKPAARGGVIMSGTSGGWEEQIRQITDLKSHPVYGDRVFPFLAVDPRRLGIADYAMSNVGKGKLFSGIKLYCPNGYSPTDPLLFGTDGLKGGIYAFCEENGIPVTAHNSDGGFATLSKSVLISGLIHCDGMLKKLDNELLIFKKSIFAKDAIYERAVTLNHPLIWAKVVEKYPGLILNLAHFGGGEQLEAAIDNPDDETLWSNRIISLIKDSRYKVYTDVSCFSEFGSINKFIQSPIYNVLKKKILYGSDYTLLLLFEDDFDNNVRQFRESFGSDFDIIAGSNPQEFLKHVV